MLLNGTVAESVLKSWHYDLNACGRTETKLNIVVLRHLCRKGAAAVQLYAGIVNCSLVISLK